MDGETRISLTVMVLPGSEVTQLRKVSVVLESEEEGEGTVSLGPTSESIDIVLVLCFVICSTGISRERCWDW